MDIQFDDMRAKVGRNTNVNAAMIEAFHEIADAVQKLNSTVEAKEYGDALHRNAHNFASDVLKNTKIDPAIVEYHKAQQKQEAGRRDSARRADRWDGAKGTGAPYAPHGTDPQGNPLSTPLPRGADGPGATFANPMDPNSPAVPRSKDTASGAAFDTPHLPEHPPEAGPGEIKDESGRIINPLERTETPPKRTEAKPLTKATVLDKK